MKSVAVVDFCLVTAGLLIRLGFSPFTSYAPDMNVWQTVGSAILSGQNPYTLPSNGLIYPPLWGLVCAASSLSYQYSKNVFASYLALKLPIIIADVLIALVIRQMVYKRTRDVRKSQVAMAVYLFNPVTILVSSLWGMFDAIPALLALLSVIYLSETKYAKSGLALGAGIAFKGFFPALLLPFFVFLVWTKERKAFECLRFILYSTVIPLLVSVPFLLMNPISYLSMLTFPARRLPQNLTYWFPIRAILQNVTPDLNLIDLAAVVSSVAFVVSYFMLLYRKGTWHKSESSDSLALILKGSILVILLFFLTASTVNEQYFIWVLSFLIAYVLIYRESLRLPFYFLCLLVALFVVVNMGMGFFAPVIQVPVWWIVFRQTLLWWTLLNIIGVLFSLVCVYLVVKIWQEESIVPLKSATALARENPEDKRSQLSDCSVAAQCGLAWTIER